MRTGPVAIGPTSPAPGAAGTAGDVDRATAPAAASVGVATAGTASASDVGRASLGDSADKRRLLSSPAETSDASSSRTFAQQGGMNTGEGGGRCNEQQQKNTTVHWRSLTS